MKNYCPIFSTINCKNCKTGIYCGFDSFCSGLYIIYIYIIYIRGNTIELSGSMEGKSFNTYAGICPYRSINSYEIAAHSRRGLSPIHNAHRVASSGTGRCRRWSCNSTSIDNIDNSRYRQDADIIDSSMCR